MAYRSIRQEMIDTHIGGVGKDLTKLATRLSEMIAEEDGAGRSYEGHSVTTINEQWGQFLIILVSISNNKEEDI